MSTFYLQIVTPDGVCYDGDAEKLIVRTTTGDVCILPKHINYVVPLGMGEAKIVADGTERRGACIGGMLSVNDNKVMLVPTTFEWAEDIDLERATKAEATAEKRLEDKEKLTSREIAMAEAKLKRAMVRQSVAKR
jgi:F-type H+-transporting ATPase subunit epsilon